MPTWAKRNDVGFDVLEQVQGSLTVDMIMIGRSDLMTCRCEDNAAAVMDLNEDKFSFLPVEDAAGNIQGLYNAEQWFDKEAPHQPIGDDFEHLSEDLVIGTDASILEFVKTACEHPTRLVISSDQVVGLISLSDLQQLPVRAALFTLVTSLEMAMAERIETEWPAADDWLKLLNGNKAANIREKIKKAKREDSFVSEIVLTQLSDKATIILEQELLPESQSNLRRDFKAIRKLRNDIAHANYYAETPGTAREVVAVVKKIFRIKESLLRGIEKRDSTTKCDTPLE